jgi:hypothetical protein
VVNSWTLSSRSGPKGGVHVLDQLLGLLPLNFLNYDFMKNALIGVLLIAPLFGLAGTLVVKTRFSP